MTRCGFCFEPIELPDGPAQLWVGPPNEANDDGTFCLVVGEHVPERVERSWHAIVTGRTQRGRLVRRRIGPALSVLDVERRADAAVDELTRAGTWVERVTIEQHTTSIVVVDEHGDTPDLATLAAARHEL